MTRSLTRLLPLLLLGVASAAWGQEPPLDMGTDVADAAEAAVESGGLFKWLVLAVGIGVIAVLAFVGRRFAATLTLVAGLGLVFVGERLFYAGSMHWALTGTGVLAVVASLGMRAQSMVAENDGSRRKAQLIGLIAATVTASALVLYALTQPIATDALDLTGESLVHWRAVFTVLVPIVLICGLIPTLFVDRVLAENPVMVPTQAPRRAAIAGLSTGLALALLFPLNYVANADKYSVEADYSYFRVTGVGTRTQGIVRSLSEPVTAYLYYGGGNQVRNKVEPYFRTLADASGGLLTVEVVDQAVRPNLAEEHNIRDNGWVVLATEDASQKFDIGTDLDRAKRKLTKLDATVVKHLLKLTSDAQVAYFLTGHGEASWRERENDSRKLSKFKRDLEDLNFKVEPFGVTEGSAVAVPDDAALVVVAAPLIPLFAEEERAIKAYIDGGGAVLLLLDPGAAPMTGLLDHLGLTAGTNPVANEQAHIVYTGGIADRILIATNRFGSHDATTTVSRNSARNPLVLPTVLAIRKKADAADTVTTLVRSYPDSWEDGNNNRVHDADEPGQVFDLAVAVERDDGFRAAVVGDVAVFSELAYNNAQANVDFAADLAAWLVAEGDLVGETEREDDVEIRHTRDDDKAWFWGTILGVPLLILALGGILVNVRRRKS